MRCAGVVVKAQGAAALMAHAADPPAAASAVAAAHFPPGAFAAFGQEVQMQKLEGASKTHVHHQTVFAVQLRAMCSPIP